MCFEIVVFDPPVSNEWDATGQFLGWCVTTAVADHTQVILVVYLGELLVQSFE